MEIDWSIIGEKAYNDDLYDYMITNISTENQLTLYDKNYGNLLTQACSGKNIKAVIHLILNGIEVNAKTNTGSNALRYAIYYTHYEKCDELISILLSAGADADGALAYSLYYNKHENGPIRTLLFHLVKLKNVSHSSYRQKIEDWMVTCERQAELCRDVIVTLLGLKKRNTIPCLRKLDRFLVKQVVAVEIWTTRAHNSWSMN